MSQNRTIVICVAGAGSRLGLGIPKALIDLDGKPLIVRQLEMLDKEEDIRIVVGFQAQKVIDTVSAYRKNVTFIMNDNYANTGTGGSFSLANHNAREYIVNLDGDLLVHPEDLENFLALDGEYLAGVPISTDRPMKLATFVKDSVLYASDFSYEHGQYEWSGLMIAKSVRVPYGEKHVCDLLRSLLPLPVKLIRAKEIDTINDYHRALAWLNNHYSD